MAPAPKEHIHTVEHYENFETGFVNMLPDLYRGFGEELVVAATQKPEVLEYHTVCYLPKTAAALLRVQHNFNAEFYSGIRQVGVPREMHNKDYTTPVIGGVPYYTSAMRIEPWNQGTPPDIDTIRLDALLRTIKTIPDEDVPFLFDRMKIPEGYLQEEAGMVQITDPREAIIYLIDVYNERGIEGIASSLYRPPVYLVTPLIHLTSELVEIRQITQYHIIEEMKVQRRLMRAFKIVENELPIERLRQKKQIPKADFDVILNTLALVNIAVMLNVPFAEE